SDSEYMAGQLSAFGYVVSENAEGADLWLINTMCASRKSRSERVEGVSIVGGQQINRVIEVVEETLKGHDVRLLNRKTLSALDLPKVRRNKFVDILPINVGYLGACTYCKTKHARGHLGSYTIDSLVTILSGADNRPLMLEKTMYDSWKSIMELYMMNRQHGRMILESVENGPLIWPEEYGVTRPKKYSELSATEAIQDDCDIKATNIILQGLPPEVYALVSNHKVAKELWERI
ncbi:hypothetical protein Tco_1097318, partial [Tanacetum coccineum]